VSEQAWRRSDKAIFSEVGDDIVALHVERGNCYGMEKVTAAVWELLDAPQTLDEIVGTLVERYDVGADQCRAEIAELLQTMSAEGLIEPA
jgi:hypothetical protein